MTVDSYTYTFFGKIFPERANVNISPIVMKVNNKEAGIIGVLKTSIVGSQLSAQFLCKQKVDNIFTLKNYADDAIRLQVDVLGYTLSCGYDIEITSMIDSLGNPQTVFGVNFDNIEQFKKQRPKNFSEIMKLFSDEKGNHLRLCMGDLREAIRNPKDRGFFCYRAIESLMQYFVKNGLDRDKTWQIFRENVGVNKDQIDFIKKFADPVRHGTSIYISPENGKKILDHTWEIVDKYILFAANGYKKIK